MSPYGQGETANAVNNILSAAKDAELGDWLNNYITVAASNESVLGLTAGEVAATQTAIAIFESKLTAAAAAHAAAKTATLSKDEARRTAEKIVRAQVKRIQANTAVPNSLRSQLKITVPKPRQKALPVFVPAKAVAKLEAGGIISLTWDANGNAPGVIYVIETSASVSSGWSMVNAQSATRFLDAPVSGGAAVYYRVRAQRAKVVSDPSNVVVANAGQSSGAGGGTASSGGGVGENPPPTPPAFQVRQCEAGGV